MTKTRTYKLTIELVPSTVWFSSVYQICKRNNKLSEWTKLKQELFEREGRRCWICGEQNRRLEAHEFWQYDDKNHVQKLVAIHHICDLCHKVKHIGFWCYTERGQTLLKKEGLSRQDLINHFCKVNNCTEKDFKNHENEAFRIWMDRSEHRWSQDFGKYTKLISPVSNRKRHSNP